MKTPLHPKTHHFGSCVTVEEAVCCCFFIALPLCSLLRRRRWRNKKSWLQILSLSPFYPLAAVPYSFPLSIRSSLPHSVLSEHSFPFSDRTTRGVELERDLPQCRWGYWCAGGSGGCPRRRRDDTSVGYRSIAGAIRWPGHTSRLEGGRKKNDIVLNSYKCQWFPLFFIILFLVYGAIF